MALRLVFVGLVLVGMTLFGGLWFLRSVHLEKPEDLNKAVYVQRTESGFQLIRNGEPFYIRGAGGSAYFKELAEIGGNTIRVFDTTNLKEKLDEAHRHGLAVIVDLYMPPFGTSYNFYGDEIQTRRLKRQVREIVVEHKDHPALLIWNLGNELKYPLVFRKNEFIRTFNDLLSMVQELDPNHPVSTSVIGSGRKSMISIYIHSPGLDIVSFNTFGNTKFVKKHVAQVAMFFGDRPYLVSELGPDGPWESSSTSWGAPIEAATRKKANLYQSRSMLIEQDRDASCLGSLVFYWGEKLERTHTWFSLFRDGKRSESIRAIQAIWNSTEFNIPNNGLNQILVNRKGAHENIVLSPGDSARAELLFQDEVRDDVQIEWEIYPEAWFAATNEHRLAQYGPVDSWVHAEGNRATFLVPETEGPYRIFVYIHSPDGYFETANLPFYVLGRTGA